MLDCRYSVLESVNVQTTLNRTVRAFVKNVNKLKPSFVITYDRRNGFFVSYLKVV